MAAPGAVARAWRGSRQTRLGSLEAATPGRPRPRSGPRGAGPRATEHLEQARPEPARESAFALPSRRPRRSAIDVEASVEVEHHGEDEEVLGFGESDHP